MALHTETYENVLKRWCSYCGIEYADLLSNEAELFKQYAQARLRKIWSEADWPDSTNISEEVLTDQSFTADTSIAYLYGVFEFNPFSTFTESIDSYRYRRLQDTVYVYGSDVPDTVYALYKQRVPTFTTATDTIPYRFAEYVAAGAAADYHRVEQDTENANAYEQRAQAVLMDELEIHELDEQARRWDNGKQVYPTEIY